MSTVLATGVFDLLHQEHMIFLRKAAELGDKLIVGVESDQRVRRMKGEGRPVQTQQVRIQQLRQLKIAHQVIALPEQFDAPADHLALLQKYRPQILAVSSHTAHIAEKQRLMAQIGGSVVVVHQHNPKISTTRLIDHSQTE